MATLKGSTLAATYDLLVKRHETYVQTGTNIELMTDSSGATAPTGLYLESGATTDNVGIGTATPVQNLHIVKTENSATGGACLLIHNEQGSGDTNAGIMLRRNQGVDWTIENNNGDLYFEYGSTLTTLGSGTNALAIKGTTGNVGIGTASPTAQLHIVKSSTVSDQFILESTSTTTDDAGPEMVLFRNADLTDAGNLGAIKFNGLDSNGTETEYVRFFAEIDDETQGTEDGTLRFQTFTNAQHTDVLTLYRGYVGLGITTPTSRLHILGINSGTDDTLTLERSEADINSHGIGNIYFRGSHTSDTNQHRRGAAISAIAHGQWDANDHANYAPTRLQFYTNDDSTTDTIAAAPRMTIDMDGNVGIGDIAPEGLLCLNQGAGDDEIMTFKSSDIAHGMTDFTETDTYARFQKSVGATGGLHISGLAETGANIAMSLAGYPTDEDNTRSTSGSAAVRIMGALKSSATVGDMGADKNILVIRNNATTRFIFDTDGEMHSDAIIGVGDDWDEWSDLQMASDLSRLPKAKFNEMMKYSSKDFERAGLLTLSVDEEGNQHAFIKHKAMLMFSMCCFGETYNRISALEEQNKLLANILRKNNLLSEKD